MSGLRIEVREYIKRGPNGDRDRGPGVEYSDFQVVFVHPEGVEWCALNVEGYDNFGCCPLDHQVTRARAFSYAEGATAFFATPQWRWRLFRQKPPKPQPTEWEEAPTDPHPGPTPARRSTTR